MPDEDDRPTGILHPGHIGIYVDDLELMTSFYQRMLGFTITDGSVDAGLVFLSTRPDYEHHMLVLIQGRNAPRDTRLINQISFRADSLAAVLQCRRRLAEWGATFDREVSHGNAVGTYFFDPEGNRVEVYWPSGFAAPQPFMVDLDLSADEDDVRAQLTESLKQIPANEH